MIYADLESILVPEDNSKENPKTLTWSNIKNMLLPVINLY